MNAIIRYLSAVFLLAASVGGLAHAQLRVDIKGGTVEPMPIALPPLAAMSEVNTAAGSLTQISDNMIEVITNNLENTGLFRAVDPKAFLVNPGAQDRRPDFAVNWRPLGAKAMITGRISMMPDGNVRVEFRLWDVLSENQMDGMSYRTPVSNWRRIAHVISDRIYQRLTGEEGYFDTRIVYISETGPALNRVKKLAIMDQDGANQRNLTDGSYLVMTPRFSPDRQVITYLSYFNNKPRVYLFDIVTNRFEVLGEFDKNMTFSPRFSPDGNHVTFSLSDEGNSDIYTMNLRTRRMVRLTDHPGIDTSPSYAPTGDRIVFNSDRGGTQQLYTMNVDGSDVQRISYGRGRYATPVWSPRGDLIAFTKIADRKFRIGVMRPDGSGERLLTNSYQDEGPTWSPNGRVLMFFRKAQYRTDGSGGETTLWSVDLTGLNERQIKTKHQASDPAWSPPLPLRKNR